MTGMSGNRMVDRNSMRSGAGLSAVVLLVAFVFGWRAAVPAVGIALGVGSLFGLRYSPLGAIYRSTKKTFKLRVPVDPEEEPPPRFAQTLGFGFLTAASLAFLPHWNALGWTLALIVAGLQALLASTGLCIGCEIYLYAKRFSAKEAQAL
jgi:hypothetical protein